MEEYRALIAEYKKKKPEIKKRIEEFSEIYNSTDRSIFLELCFCILTPQAKAVYCDKAVKELSKDNLILNGSKSQVRSKLNKVRFPNNKTSYLLYARDYFCEGEEIKIKSKIDETNVFKTRDWLVEEVKGIGYKEASHFLRNIGLGKNLAILDRHILSKLKEYGTIEENSSITTKKGYLNIEDKFREFSEYINIPMQELDLLFWSQETGFIFK